MMMQNEVLDLAPKEAAKKIKEYKYKRITVMFDYQNYIFTDCPLLDNMHNIMTVESYSGEWLYLGDYNCGYGGSGPSKTMELLRELGYDGSDSLKYENGIQIDFSEDGKIKELYGKRVIRKGFPFETRYQESEGKIYLAQDDTVVDLQNKKIFFLGLNKDNYLALIKLLDSPEICPVKMNYYIGCQNDRDFGFPRLPVKYSKNRKIVSLRNGSYIEIETDKFDIVALLGNKNPASYINTVSLFLNEYAPFDEDAVNSQKILMSKSKRGFGSKRKIEILIRNEGELEDTIAIDNKKRGSIWE